MRLYNYMDYNDTVTRINSAIQFPPAFFKIQIIDPIEFHVFSLLLLLLS